jgi:hypothetical protein
VNADATEIVLNASRQTTLLKRTTHPTPMPARLADNEFAPRDNSDLQGYWKGKLGTGGGLPLFWKIAESSNGTFRAELDNPMQGAFGQPATVVYNPPAVDLIVNSGSGMFHGTLNQNKTTLTGAWIHGGGFTPASFKMDIYQPQEMLEAGKTYQFTSPGDLQGHWKGTLEAQGVKIRLLLAIGKLADGSFVAEMASPDTPGNGDPVPATRFQYLPPEVLGEWQWIGGQLKGKFEDGKLTATLKIGLLGPNPVPITFERSAAN